MKCKHENTKKMFWLNQQRGKWMKTNYSICTDCGMAVGLQPLILEVKDKKKTLPDKTKDALNVLDDEVKA